MLRKLFALEHRISSTFISSTDSYRYEDVCSDSYDTIEFTASEMCLACGGGQAVEDTWYMTQEMNQECDDSMWNDRTDRDGDGCSAYTINPGWCGGGYDDDDFSSNEMCCACGGGDHETNTELKVCINTDHDSVNPDGYSCSYLNWLHDNENVAYDCQTQADTSNFTASSMCCACGGGEAWTLGSVPGHVENRCVDISSEQNQSCASSQCGLYDNSSELCCVCGGGEHGSFLDVMTPNLNSEGHSCSDISHLLTYGFDDLCTTSYDTIDFTASKMCLDCGGGQRIHVPRKWYESIETQEVSGECDDSMYNNLVNSHGVGCGFLSIHDSLCTQFQDELHFTASEMCCVCGGGEREILVPYEPATLCVDTDLEDEVNADGYSCAYVNFFQINDNIDYDCETQADTSEFTASNMCCTFDQSVNQLTLHV